MGKFAKLVDTEEKIVEFKKRYGIPEDVHIRYVPYGDLALVLNQDLVLPMVAIIEGGVRIPMHTFLLQFLAHFRLSPLQCAPNVFRIVMGTAVLMEKLGLDLTVHDITYVYSLQATGRDQYTLFARNAYRKLVTGLPDSSKGRDEDFLVFTGNWQNPHINCSLRPGVPDKEFTAKKVELVERRTVEHLLQKPCFIDSGGRPRAASVLLDYVPSYKSFQKGPIVKHFRQEEVTVVRPGKDQEDIIQAVPLTARKGVQVPRLVPPLSDPNFIPSIESSEAGLPIIQGRRLQSRHGPSPSASPLPPSPWIFSRRRCHEEEKEERNRRRMMKAAVQEGSSPPQPSKAKETRFLKSGRGVRGGQVAEAVGKALLLPEDMKVWQEKRSKYMLENLKRDSILAVQGIFEAGNRLLETERRLNLSADEIKRLKDLESSASVRIRAAESAQKSAEAGLLNLQNQVAELQRKLDSEHKSASQVRIENSQLKEALAEAEVKADKGAQAYYDQGVNQASQDLRYQLRGECNKYFVQGWHQALDNAGRRETSWRLVRVPLENPTVLGSPEALSEPVLVDDTKAAEDRPDDQIPAAESQEGEEGSDVDETIDVVD
uniref:Transposase (putative) gypsy type domain-containing protein n=1 Tax=Fagus sylvatica TaxID=28930 RepID=A0A2N9IZ18_FAGSY